jgi:hypothetical protein
MGGPFRWGPVLVGQSGQTFGHFLRFTFSIDSADIGSHRLGGIFMHSSLLDRISVRAKLWLLAGSLMVAALALGLAGFYVAYRLTNQSSAMTGTLARVA